MTWFIVPIVAMSMIGGAIALEFAFRNLTVRPLSRHSLNRRRWSDPNNRERSVACVPGGATGSSMMPGHHGFYTVSKDPADQAKLLAG